MKKNRLIADFMGITPELIDTIPYDTSLDYLFEVVEKIESLGYRTELYSGLMILFRIGKPNQRRYFLEYSYNTKFETIYNACVGFIEWYNKQNLKHETKN